MNKKLEDLMRQASFHQMYGEEPVPMSNIKMYKNIDIDTTESKKILGLDFAGNAELRMFASRIHDQMEEQTRRLTNRIVEIQDMKFRRFIHNILSLDFGYEFAGCGIEVVEPNHLKLVDYLSGDFLTLYIERTDIASPTNHWIELKWELYHHGKKLRDGRDFLNMEVKVNWSY
ncbi:hypothetical protein MG295_00072 [Bacillus phage vB_BcgM]|nr:hypothetical protein MG295_00072 [Bacillus phage vB_BcgM]